LLGPLPCLVVVLVAVVVAWAALEATLPVFQLPEELAQLAGNLNNEQIQSLRAGNAEIRKNNAMVGAAILASILALAITVAELLKRRAPVKAVWGGLLAAAVGAGAGVGAALLGVIVLTSFRSENPLMKTMVVQGVTLGVVGLGVGIAVALPLLRPRLLVNCMAGGLLGGILAALVFPIVVSFLPKVNTEDLVAEGLGRLVWVAVAYALIGLTMTGLGKEKPKATASSTAIG
jgi:hypothetical protein